MYNPQKTTVSNESYAILNAIRNESDIFRTSTPLVEDAQSARAFGEFVTGAGQYKELFWGILINRIALTVVSGREFKNKLAQFRRGKIGLGDIVQNIWVGLVTPEGWTSDVANPGDVYRTNKPDAKVSMSAVNCKLSYEITSNDTELGYAFTQENGLYNLVSKIAERLITSEQTDDYIMMKWVIAHNILSNIGGTYNPIHEIDEVTDQTTADKAIRDMKEVVNDYPFMKTKYNEAGVPAPCPTDEVIFITTSKSRADFDVLALSKAFNLQYEQYIGQEVQIDEFGFDAFSLARLYDILDEQVTLGLIPSYNEFTDEQLELLSSIESAVIDKDWFMSFDKVYEMNNIYDVKHLNNNTFLTIHRIYSYNPFANCTYFAEKKTEPVVPATLTFESSSGQVTGNSTYSIPITDITPAPTSLNEFNIVRTGAASAEITELGENDGHYFLRITTTTPTVAGEVASFSVTYEPEGYLESDADTFDLTVLGVQNVVPSGSSAVLNVSDPNEDSTDITLTENGEAYTGSVTALSFDQTVATVSVNDNVVTIQGVDAGSTTVYITCQKPNYGIIDIPVSVVVSKESVSVVIDSPTPSDPEVGVYQMSVNDTAQMSISVTPVDATLEYESSDPTIASVSDSGLITALTGGQCNIYVTGSKENYYPNTTSIAISVS